MQTTEVMLSARRYRSQNTYVKGKIGENPNITVMEMVLKMYFISYFSLKSGQAVSFSPSSPVVK